MAVDHSLPTLSTNYADFLTTISDRIEDAVKAFDGTDYTNIPTGAMGWDRTNDFWKEWNSSSWTTQVLSAAGGGTGVTSLAALATAMNLGDLSLLDTINNTNWSGEPLAVAHGGTGVDTIGELQTALSLLGMAYQAANSVAITGGSITGLTTFTCSAATITTLNGTYFNSSTGIGITAANGNNISFTIGSDVRLQIPVGTTGALLPGTDADLTLGSSSFKFSETHSEKFVVGTRKAFEDNFLFSEVLSLDPAAAGISTIETAIINYVLTLTEELARVGIVDFA